MDKHTFTTISKTGACIFFVVAFFQANNVSAQYKSKFEKFKVDQIRGCSPFKIELTSIEDCNPCNIDFLGNGKNIQLKDQSKFPYYYEYTNSTSEKVEFNLVILYKNIGYYDSIKITVDPNLQPDYEVYSCKGSKVSVKITDKTYDQYLVDFDGNGSVDKTVLSGSVALFSYTTSGDYTIGVIGQFKNGAPNCKKNDKPFKAIETLPSVQLKALTAVDKNNLKIDFTPDPNPNIQYKLEIAANAASNFQNLQMRYATDTYTTNAVDLDKDFYCIRVGAYDACDRSVNEYDYSSTVCTQKVDLDIESGVNTVSWESDLSGVQFISIHRTGGGGNSESNINPDSFSFKDRFPEIMCNTDYSYYLVFNYPSGATSTSLIKSDKSALTLTPNAIANVSTITNGQSVTLTWQEDPLQDPYLTPNTYSVLKSINKNPYLLPPDGTLKPSNPPTLTYQDNAYSEQSKMCYKINYVDACLNRNENGKEACPMVLQGTLDKKNSVRLDWESYVGWQNGVKYYLVNKYSKDGNLLSSEKASPGFVDDKQDLVNQIVSYQLTAIANDGSLIPSTSNIITIEKTPNLFYPTAFTPNGDDINDTFIVSGQFVEKMDLKIYDRWGGLLFSTDKNQPWTGYYNGKLLTEDAYIWKAVITDFSGKTSSHAGTVLLLTKSK
jgi:gliding motility-associated-like protein